jgi:outer membrane lipoprotein-sorting protein
MRIPSLFVLLIAIVPWVIGSSGVTAEASSDDAMKIIKDMKEVFEPERASVRKIGVSVSGDVHLETHWTARKASMKFPSGKRTLLVMVAPPDVRGNAVIIEETKDESGVKWVYVPLVRRVRKILPVGAYEHFLNTDFTYADLGFVDYQGTYELLGDEEKAGEPAYKVAFMPKNSWYYSRVITWVSKKTHLPLERNYYDINGKLWKRETFEQATIINGIPTPLRIRMRDVQNESESLFAVSEVRFDLDIPKDLFNPKMLPKAAESPFWENLESGSFH